jgi:hypothetical protein
MQARGMAEAGTASFLARALVRPAIARARAAGGKLPPPRPPPAHPLPTLPNDVLALIEKQLALSH